MISLRMGKMAVGIPRREFIAILGGATLGLRLAAHAQQVGQFRRIGILLGSSEGDPQAQAGLAKLTKALQELGWTDGSNIRIDYRWANADVERMQTFAKELVDLKPDLIVGHTTPVVAALQRQTKTIPIVFVIVSDPVGSGFVASLPHPGGNITGFINIESSLSGKWIELLKEIMPHVTRAVLMFNPVTAPYFNYYLQPFESAARASTIEPITVQIHTPADIEHAIANIGARTDTGLVIMPDIFMTTRDVLNVVISVAAHNHVPTIYPYRYMVAAGGLVSYGIDITDLYRRAADYVDRILKGADPANLPVQLPTLFELAVNLKTAKALSLNMPGTLIARADEVVE
jgi:putative tryptophan/tyrosine transport system substrate-binding protein